MIEITLRPHALSFAANPIVFSLRTNNPVGSTPYRAKGARSIMTGSQPIVQGTIITLTFLAPDGISASIDFTATASVALDTDIPLSAGADLTAIALKIQKHYLVAPYLILYYDATNQALIAESKTIEPNWDIEISTPQYVTSFEDYVATDAPSGYKINYKVVFEEVYKQNNWRVVHTGVLNPHEDGSDIHLNISDIINKECKSSLKENPFSHYPAGLPTLTDNRRRYYIMFQESNDTTAGAWITEPIKTVIMGGIPHSVWLTYYNWFVFAGNDQSRTWLSYQPAIKKVRYDSIEWVSFFNPLTTPNESISVAVKTLNDQGVWSDFAIVPNTTIEVQPLQTITFSVSPAVLGLSVNVRAYSLRIVSTDTQINISDSRQYIVDSTPYRNIRQLAYLNAFGCPETVTCYGELSKPLNIESSMTQGIRGVTYAGQITRENRRTNTIDLNYVYRTGFISAAMKEALTELAISPVLFDVTTPQYFALILKAEKINNELIGSTDEYQYSWEWIAKPRIPINAFATDSIIRKAPTLVDPDFDYAGFTTDIDTGGSITITPLRYAKADNVSSDTLYLVGISATTAAERLRMRFYRGNFEIFLDGDIVIESGDVIRFTIPFDNETFRAYY